MRARLQRLNLKLVFAFCAVITALVAQDVTSYLTPDVVRVGDHLACRCGGCRNTVGNCPMLRCGSADPLRRRIHQMKMTGMSDQDIINTIVQEQGTVALATPPTGTFGGVITWIMPGVALLVGFWVYATYVKRNSKPAQSVVDEKREQTIQAYIREINQKSDDEA